MATTNTEFYQLMEGATRMGYSIEATPGTDPADARIRMPGAVIGNPALTEDRKHETYQPLGADADPQFAQSLGNEFTVTVEHLLEEGFIGANEFFSLGHGTINATTGSVTNCRPLRTKTLEWGWQSKFEQEIEITVGGADDGTYRVTINGTDYDFVASSSSVSAIVAGLQAAVDADPNVTAVDNDPILTVTADTAGTPFTFAVSTITAPSANLEVTETKNVGWYHLLSNSKINSTTITANPADKVMAQHEIMGTIHEDGRVTEVTCTGDNLSDLAAYTGPSARFKDCVFTLKKKSGDTIDAEVRDFSITFSNNLSAEWSDNQSLNPTHLIEGERRVTFNLTTTKTNNDLLDISRNDPSSTDGQLDLTVLISVPSGFYMEVTMPTCILADRTAELGQGVTHVTETFSGMVIGAYTIDMSSA